MTPVACQPTISAGEQQPIHALDRAVTGTGNNDDDDNSIIIIIKRSITWPMVTQGLEFHVKLLWDYKYTIR